MIWLYRALILGKAGFLLLLSWFEGHYLGVKLWLCFWSWGLSPKGKAGDKMTELEAIRSQLSPETDGTRKWCRADTFMALSLQMPNGPLEEETGMEMYFCGHPHTYNGNIEGLGIDEGVEGPRRREKRRYKSRS